MKITALFSLEKGGRYIAIDTCNNNYGSAFV